MILSHIVCGAERFAAISAGIRQHARPPQGPRGTVAARSMLVSRSEICVSRTPPVA